MGWKIVLLSAALLLDVGCTTEYITRKQTSYTMYPNISMTQIGSWTRTDIEVPRGAMVAIMAEAGIRGVQAPQDRSGPTGSLRVRVGKEGRFRGLNRYYDSAHVRVFKNLGEGELQYNIRRPSTNSATNRAGKITATIIIWNKENLNRVHPDIQDLILVHPNQKQYQALLFSLAMCYTHIGEYSKAEMVLQTLRDSLGREGRDSALALFYSANNEKWLRRYDKMKTYAEEALEISRREGYKGLEGENLLIISEALAHLGKLEDAENLATKALQLSREMRFGSNVMAGRAHLTLGMMYLSANRVPESLQHSQKAVECFTEAGTWVPLAQSNLLLGQAQSKSDMGDEARKSYESALKVASAISRADTLWRSHSQLGRMDESEGNPAKAFDHYAQAIKVIEDMRIELEDPSLRPQFMEDKLYVYEWMIQLLHKLKRDEDAFQYLERSKARLMLDMLREKVFSSKNNEMNELLAREQRLKEQILALSKEVSQVVLPEIEEGDGWEEDHREPGKEGNPELERLQSDLKSVFGRIDELNPDLASLLTVSPLKAKEVQALLSKETALLAYFMGSEINAVFVVTGEKVKAIPLQVLRKKIIEKVREFREQTDEGVSVKLFTSRDYEKALTELYEILIKPVEGEIAGKRHLVIVPHGMLHYLPFQALRNPEGRYLIESFTVSYLPSASVLKYARAKNKGNHADILAAANPVSDLVPLPAAEKEAREVSALFERKLVLIGPVATKTTVKSESPRYDFLLFSTHGEMIESDPLKSNLRFTPTKQDDGKLTVSEIFDMEVKANLVTLSACETGLVRGTRGDLPQGDDLVGLSRAFIHAGAPSVVASLWRVSDDSTVSMMRSFYRNLITMSKAEALRQAQSELAKASTETYSHPFFWAPFILVGDWN